MTTADIENVDIESADIKTMDAIIKKTMEAIESGKEQIYDIAENARHEFNRVKRDMDALRIKTSDLINQVDVLERKERLARMRLMTVDKNFEKFTEADIKEAYEQAQKFQIELTLLRERESQLRQKRDEMERSLRIIQDTAEKAEALISHVGVVLDFIGGKMKDLTIKVESMHQSQQMGLQIIKAQEEERKRVAREIHDGPAQSMANVVLRMEFCEKLIDIDVQKLRLELQELKENVRANLQDVRKIIFDLRPMALDDLGLIPALKRHVADYEEKNSLPVKLSIYGEEQRFKPALEIALFRLVQESLNNVKKHAQATEVTILVRIEAENIKIIVKDNGIGFDLKQVNSGNRRESFGLISMRERVEMLEGDWEIKTAPGKGTEIHLRIPTECAKGDYNGKN